MEPFNCYNESFKKFAVSFDNTQLAIHAYGRHLYDQGKFSEAIPYFHEAIHIATQAQQKPQSIDYALLGLTHYALGQLKEAYEALKNAHQLEPTHCGYLSDLGDFACLLGLYDEAISYHNRCFELKPENIIPLDSLVWSYVGKKDVKTALEYGLKSLEAKDKQACDAEHMQWLFKAINRTSLDFPMTIKPFNPLESKKNIIAFSLWGKDPRYTANAIKNAILAEAIYPGWQCRFYCDATVPPEVIAALKESGAQIIAAQARGAFYGLLWRFRVMEDPEVDFFLLRDCDSLINCQERVAVDEWLDSKTCFHIMRDAVTDTELIAAGMFGGRANLIPGIINLIDKFYDENPKVRNIDQLFTRMCLWPFVKQSSLTHDSFYKLGNSKPFPRLGHYPSRKWHVGQNVSLLKKPL